MMFDVSAAISKMTTIRQLSSAIIQRHFEGAVPEKKQSKLVGVSLGTNCTM